MPVKSETLALMAVVDRLAMHFPDHPRSVIEDVVANEHSLFDGGRVRDYVPILVERAAKLRLGSPLALGPQASTVSAPGGSPAGA